MLSSKDDRGHFYLTFSRLYGRKIHLPVYHPGLLVCAMVPVVGCPPTFGSEGDTPPRTCGELHRSGSFTGRIGCQAAPASPWRTTASNKSRLPPD